jgi:sugar/nucleoside kinase (ribokinase family)
MWPLPLRSAARFDVLGVGANTDDHLCVVASPPGIDTKQPLADYLRQPGGQVPTALVALQRWGARTAYVGVFGDDDGGARQRAALIADGVDVGGCIVRTSVGSHTSMILVDRISGARTVLWHEPRALALRLDEIDRTRLEDARVVLLDDEDLERAVQVAGWARAAGAAVVLDVDTPRPAIADLIARADIVIVSGGFPQRFTGKAALRPALRALARLGPTLIVATLGGGGALACAHGDLTFVPAVAVPVVDTTSAGDVFHAGVIHGVLRHWSLPETLRFAAIAAALTCTALGGRGAIPSLTAIESV